MDGREAQEVLDRIGITTNKQVIPDDPLPPFKGSGIRIGTPAATTRGMAEEQMQLIAQWIVAALRDPKGDAALEDMAHKVKDFCRQFPVPGFN
jgi:glycine hydroxymethyltransferase